MAIVTGRFWLCALLCCVFNSISVKAELRLLHVLSGNKFYVPDFNPTSTEFQAPKNLSYEYFLSNAVDMPNSVKLDLFNLGAHLRANYGEFIGSVYNDEVSKMHTEGFPVSIMAGQLINAGLWPSVEKNDILFEYLEVDKNPILLGTLCPNFERDTQKVIKDYKLNEKQKALLEYIKENGINVENPIDVLMLSLALNNSNQLNQTFPKWITDIYPSKDLTDLTLTAYDLLSTTTLQKRLNGGSFLKKIIDDSRSQLNGSLHTNRRINIYSGDDRIVEGVSVALDVTLRCISNDAICLLAFQENNEIYLTVTYYQSDIKEETPISLPGCGTKCPIDKFEKLVADLLPNDEQSLCASTMTEVGIKNANNILVSNSILSFVSLILLYLNTKV